MEADILVDVTLFLKKMRQFKSIKLQRGGNVKINLLKIQLAADETINVGLCTHFVGCC